jgi:hypothetical protein
MVDVLTHPIDFSVAVSKHPQRAAKNLYYQRYSIRQDRSKGGYYPLSSLLKQNRANSSLSPNKDVKKMELMQRN